MSSYKHVCLIPAKSKSTRLKDKNILKIGGQELIHYPIVSALKSKIFNDHVIVSTDSEDYRKIALRHGAQVPYLRDEKLAKDPYGVADVAIDFLERFPEYQEFDTMCIMLPTCPLTSIEDLKKAYDIFENSDTSVLMSVVETDHNAYRSVEVNDDKIQPMFEDYILEKSQDLKTTYRINGAIAIINVKEFMRSRSYFTFPISAYNMPKNRSIDIDTEFDFIMAETMFNLSK